MTAYIRRFSEVPSLEVATEIESINVVDATPRTPTIGVGSGAMLIVGEFEDGPFNTPTEVFGETDEFTQFGGFGYQRGDALYQDPSARLHLGEFWNGNGFLKGKFLRPPRKMICRVDTSVGSVRFSPAAALTSATGPFRLEAGQTMTINVDGGGGVATTAIAATAAHVDGTDFSDASGYTGGEQIGITVDNNPEIIVTFQAGDQTGAQVVSRINLFAGTTIATEDSTMVDLDGIQQGTGGQLVLRDVTAGALAAIGLTAGTTDGTGNVANLAAVTATEIIPLLSPVTGSTGIDSDGALIIQSDGGGSGTILITIGAMATALGFATGVTVTGNIGDATTIPAGTRVLDATTPTRVWLTMQTINVPAGTAEAPNTFFDVEVRPATDNGTETALAAGLIDTIVDRPVGRGFTVTNPDNLSAALTEDQIDVAYENAFAATVADPAVQDVTVTLSARRSDAVDAAGTNNAIEASAEENRGRVFHQRAAFGISVADASTAVALNRTDRKNFSYPGWQVRIPEIASLGAAGGQGFVDGGVITIGADGPLAYINSVINPEQNPGQDTGLLTFVQALEPIPGLVLNRQTYTAFKRLGICAPRIVRNGTQTFVGYQSEVTTSLVSGRTTQKRRKMADFIQDSLARLLIPFSKRLATDARRAGIVSAMEDFLFTLQSPDQPELMRINAFSVVDQTAQNPTFSALGVAYFKVQVQLLSSLDSIILDTEIGEGVVVVDEAA